MGPSLCIPSFMRICQLLPKLHYPEILVLLPLMTQISLPSVQMVKNGDFCPLNDTDTGINMEKPTIRFLNSFETFRISKMKVHALFPFSSGETEIGVKKKR